MKAREVVKKLEELGFRFLRNGKGDHKYYSNGTIRVTVPDKNNICPGLVRRILLQAKGRDFAMRGQRNFG